MSRLKRFLSYYKPHLPIFVLDMVCAFLVGPTAQLCFPLSRKLCAWGLGLAAAGAEKDK